MIIPYDKIELLRELFFLTQKNINEDKLKEKFEKISSKVFEHAPDNEDEILKKIAEYNQISVEELSNSPDEEVMRIKYVEHLITIFAKELAHEFEITEKQAWALIAWSKDLI